MVINSPKIRIRLKAYDYRSSISPPRRSWIRPTNRGAGGGPIPLPTAINKYCVLRSPMWTRNPGSSSRSGPKRLLDILDPTQQTIDALMKLDLACGVDVEIKL